MPTRLELQELSKKIRSYKIIFEQGLHDFVCQDCGYVLEFGLKSAICKFK